ncbi:aaa family cdc48 subfamily [Vairimorpha apis BRL 01]|uniref:Aaa family cdc48 subfamily n=1 Tax=Vairimorpha apis BRL 01 TaxID=1037528 RepID=T0MBA6_9MICR|nr:aaa family cdc48 subfamily [Vairimorpha apis BRL 01]
MKNLNSRNNVSSMLRDKYISTSLQDSLKLTNHITPFSSLRGIDYLQKSIIDLVYNPLFKRYEYDNIGAKPPATLLFYGASGVGKTYLVHSISQEYKIPVVVGNLDSEKDVRETFRKGDLNEKSIILLDNLDILNNEDNLKVINQISECLNDYKGKAVIIGICENINKLSNKLKKFDNEILIKIPSLNERKEICEKFAENVKKEHIDWIEIAKITPGFTCRDLKRLFKNAINIAVSNDRKHIIFDDFILALKSLNKQNSNITFDSIGSLDNVKEELKMSVIYPSMYPDRFKKLGITKPSGVLLYGPPGCGKTLLAKAVSNMSHCNFISVKGSELVSKYVGDSEKEIRNLFGRAKHLQPCVIFFDEIDSLCQKRSKSDFGVRIVNQILTLLDGIEDRGDVYIIGATNRIESLDKALLRPGRFDKIINVPLPKLDGCLDIFKKVTHKLPIEQFDYHILPLEGFSGAEISGIIKEAGMLCLKNNFENENAVISKQNILDAIEKYKISKKFN